MSLPLRQIRGQIESAYSTIGVSVSYPGISLNQGANDTWVSIDWALGASFAVDLGSRRYGQLFKKVGIIYCQIYTPHGQGTNTLLSTAEQLIESTQGINTGQAMTINVVKVSPTRGPEQVKTDDGQHLKAILSTPFHVLYCA